MAVARLLKALYFALDQINTIRRHSIESLLLKETLPLSSVSGDPSAVMGVLSIEAEAAASSLSD